MKRMTHAILVPARPLRGFGLLAQSRPVGRSGRH